MQKQSLSIVALLLTALFGGCGKNFSGTYVGSQTVVQNSLSTSVPLTMTLNTDSNNNVTGNWQSGGEVGTLTGQSNSSGVSSVILYINSNTGYNGVYTGCVGGQYIGSFNINNNNLTGTLTSTGGYCVGASKIVNATD